VLAVVLALLVLCVAKFSVADAGWHRTATYFHYRGPATPPVN
jgi:hypothetical protein